MEAKPARRSAARRLFGLQAELLLLRSFTQECFKTLLNVTYYTANTFRLGLCYADVFCLERSSRCNPAAPASALPSPLDHGDGAQPHHLAADARLVASLHHLVHILWVMLGDTARTVSVQYRLGEH